MRNPRCAIVAAILLAVVVAGCGQGPESKPVQYTDVTPLGGMKEQMTKQMEKTLKKSIPR